MLRLFCIKGSHHRHAFSLVELSIVLVILGLLVGTVLSAQSLIRASELRSISNDYFRFVAATQTFRDKYFALPGDITNATQLWGVAHATPATCYATASTGKETCDGDGNGLVNSSAAGSNETFRFWQHLSNAGLIEGTYTGVAGSAGTTHAIIGTNVPVSRIGLAGWSVVRVGYQAVAPYYTGEYGHVFGFGTNGAAENDYTNNPIIKAEDAYNIDTKIDDGNPFSGKVRAWKYSSRPNCVVSTDDAYALTSTNIGCNLLFITGF